MFVEGVVVFLVVVFVEVVFFYWLIFSFSMFYEALHRLTHKSTQDCFFSLLSDLHFTLHVEMQVDIS